MSRHWPSQTPLAATLCLAICALAACGHPQSCQFGCNDKTDPPKVYPSNVAARVEPALKGHFATTPLVYHQSFGEAVSVLGDCDGDGVLEAFVPATGRLFRQAADGSFADAGAPVTPIDKSAMGQKLTRPYAAMGAFADFDGDGHLDLLFADQNLFEILPGQGDCTFGKPHLLQPACVEDIAQQFMLIDADLDGLMDIVVSCSSNTDPMARLFLARGDGDYDIVTPPSTPLNGKTTGFAAFGTFLDDVDDDGTLDGFFLSDFNMGWYSWGVPGDMPVFQRDDDLSLSVGSIDGMALVPLDFDRDGRVDYFVSGSPQTNRLYWNRAARELHEIALHAGIAGRSDSAYWGAYTFDVDLDGWMDILVSTAGGSAPGESPQDTHGATPVKLTLYVNRHDGTFVDMSDQLFDDAGRHRSISLTCGDLRSDGHVGCLGADPGMGADVPGGAFLLRSEVEPAGNWVGVHLQGTVSGSNGAGARVSVEGESRPQVAVAGSQCPTGGQHDAGLLLGVGKRGTVTLRVAWPSGITQNYQDLPVGQYHTLVEPEIVQVAHRIVPADGQTTVDITVDLAASGAKTVGIDGGAPGAWLGDLVLGADGKARRTLVAPKAPGSGRVRILLDGKPLRVRPRVTFSTP